MKKFVLAAVAAALVGGAAAVAAPSNPALFTAYFNALGTLSDGATPAQAAAIVKAQAIFDKKDNTRISQDIANMAKADKILDKAFTGNADYDTAVDTAISGIFTLGTQVSVFNATQSLLDENPLSIFRIPIKINNLTKKLDINKNGTPAEGADLTANRQKFLKAMIKLTSYCEGVSRKYAD